MGRWTPGARGRLEQAALELFVEQGFAATTVPQITERAGLTTRTFFRHFADKREVFFDGDAIPQAARRLLEQAPADVDPLTLLRHGLRRVGVERFDGRREEVRRRREVILAEPALRERDAQKRDDLVGVLRPGLLARGVDPLGAALLAEAAVAVLHVALESWLAETAERSFGDVTDACFDRLFVPAAPV
ncbi:TetR/AcrR family transcriptional regulator [Quadrisphaera sp. INWT6]|uniref:TetR/AcrR family transcriptional regulator n=1 Tax=Quadrisphaera sp. INWT6 TaxID=2596917 RepID=UPI0018920FB5|nr:TetR/AcrR family transcriptional regulator [Quadrisphaera sp. INWT6]MBF5080954.1 TetR family transcriptional regulator [Quadrisphaera sp. INWT6]